MVTIRYFNRDFFITQLIGNTVRIGILAIKKFGAMHFIYQINRLTATKVESTYLC